MDRIRMQACIRGIDPIQQLESGLWKPPVLDGCGKGKVGQRSGHRNGEIEDGSLRVGEKQMQTQQIWQRFAV